jgi:hypothetical protein
VEVGFWVFWGSYDIYRLQLLLDCGSLGIGICSRVL